MKYYVIVDNNILISDSAEVLIQFYNNSQPLPEDYVEGKYIVKDGELVLNENYEAEQAEKEKERIAKLNMTGADVERGIYKAKGMDFNDILAYVTQLQPEGLDIKALGIELKANNFYRGNPYVDAVGALLGFTKEQLDKFFEDGNYEHLLVKNDEELPTNEVVEQQGNTEVE